MPVLHRGILVSVLFLHHTRTLKPIIVVKLRPCCGMYFRFARKTLFVNSSQGKRLFFSEPCIVDYRRINGPDKPSGPLYMHVSYMQRRIQKGGGGGGGGGNYTYTKGR